MPGLTERLLAELKQEGDNTRRMLERVPEDRLGWKPHPRSMSLGQLSLHLAGLPQGVSQLVSQLTSEIPIVPLPEATSREQLLSTLRESIAVASQRIAAWGDAGLDATWRMTRQGETLLTIPRGDMVRTIMLNHWYHHRGELVVYFRLLEIPVPAIYGPTADEKPFG